MTALADPLAPVPAAPAAAARPVNRARRRAQILHHVVLIFGVLLMCGPMAVTFMSSTWDPVVIHSEGLQLGYGGKFLETYETVRLR